MLPEGLHCLPTGQLGEYLQLAERLVRFASQTDQAERQWDDGDIALEALPGRYGWLPDRTGREEIEPLASLWDKELERRQRLVDNVAKELDPAAERLAVMVMANWVRGGRTPREHQKRYSRFLNVAVDGLDAADLMFQMGNTWYVNNERLPDWLDDIAGGRTCENATKALIEREHEVSRRFGRSPDEPLVQRLGDVWQAVGAHWQSMLESMALAHPGAVLALFHLYGTSIDRELLNVCIQLGPSAQLSVGHLDWAVAVVPAACRVGLAERDCGLGGLILLDRQHHRVDSAFCQRFLRNLATSLGYPELARYVSAPGDGAEVKGSNPDFERATGLYGMNFASEAATYRSVTVS
ncbi:hypothetical protein [Kibdelosporangium aridum]|nr:hypothetical protein [Kibdelosporangium aridum]